MMDVTNIFVGFCGENREFQRRPAWLKKSSNEYRSLIHRSHPKGLLLSVLNLPLYEAVCQYDAPTPMKCLAKRNLGIRRLRTRVNEWLSAGAVKPPTGCANVLGLR